MTSSRLPSTHSDNQENYQYNKWEILINTRTFRGLTTSPLADTRITLPQSILDQADSLVMTAVNRALLEDFGQDGGADGIQGVEMAANFILANWVDRPKIRVSLCTDPVGLCAVITVKYREEDLDSILRALKKKKKEIEYENKIN